MKNYNNKRDIQSTYFPIPKCIFNLGLTTGEILVYTYLMYCEDRKTHQCYPSYSTIGEAAVKLKLKNALEKQQKYGS